MSQRNGFHFLFATVCAFLGAFGHAGYARAQQPNMVLLAQRLSREPIKVDLRPTARAYREGQVVRIEVTLRDQHDEVVPSPNATEIEISETDPNNKISTQKVNFNRGEEIQYFEFTANEPGLYRIVAREAHLRPGSYFVLVGRVAHHSAHGSPLVPGIFRAAVERSGELRPVALRWASAQSPDAQTGNPPPSSSPQLMFLVPDGGHEFLADGVDPALLQVFYMSPDGSGAPTDIKVWLSWSNGVLDPKPLIIRKGETWGEANLRSKWPVDAQVKIISSSPPYPVVGTTEYAVKFGPPIYGVAAVVPENLPLVDTGTVTAQLLGPNNVPVNADKSIPVTFELNSSKIRLASASKEVEIQKGSSAVSILLVPMEIGEAQLKVSIPDRPTATYPVRVTGLVVILLCLAGGIIGGLCAFDAFKGSLFWRIFLGVVGGAVLTWIYVFVGLPQTTWAIAHSVISALFVSIVGGYMGLQVLDFAAKGMGLLEGKQQPKP
jgi:hypothetical protein